MKKNLKYLVCLALCIASAVFSASGENGYRITVSTTGLPDGTVLELVPGSLHTPAKTLAETILRKGSCVFSGELEGPRSLVVQVKDVLGGVKMVIGNEVVQVCFHAAKKDSPNGAYYQFTNEKVSGSSIHEQYRAKYKPRKDMELAFEKGKTSKMEEAAQKMNQARMAKDQEAIKIIQESPEYQKMATHDTQFFKDMESTCMKVITENGDTWWGPFMMLDFMTYFTKEQQSIFMQFSQEAKESYYGRIVYEELFPVGLIGTKLPSFTVKNNAGETLSLEQLCKEKKYILLDFWASWCGPCRREIPNLKNLYEKYKDKGFEVISVSTDKNEAVWQKALAEEKLTWPNFRDGTVADLYKVRSIPALFLMDTNGVLVAENLRGEELAAKLAEIFGLH